MEMQAVSEQPGKTGFANPQAVNVHCPPGLEYLTQIDQLLVHQKLELLEVFTGWETNNKYEIKNSMGQPVFYAVEDTNLCMRICCGPMRGFVINIMDNMQQEVMRITREFKCCAGCCWCANSDCCAFEIRVEAPVGTTVGYVRQMQACWIQNFDIMNANRDTVLKIKAPCCICQTVCCRADLDFKVFTTDMGRQIGKVSKQWPGLCKELVSDADNFGVSFPMDLDVNLKAVLLGATFLIDFMFFEQKKDNNKNN